jgi:RNA-directed DNA polymerase
VKANRGAAGVDHVTVAMYEARLDANLATLAVSLRAGTYRPQGVRRHWIPKGPRERRPLGIPTVPSYCVIVPERL